MFIKVTLRRILQVTITSALLLPMASCSTSKRGVRAHKQPRHNTTAVHYPHHATSHAQKKLLAEADTWMGTPYRFGGKEKGDGADCSGFVMMVYLNALDVKIPRNSAKQAEFCKPLKEKEVKIGDLVFFATGKDPEKVSHVGIIYDEEGGFIHASSTKGVCVSSMTNPWYQKRFIMYGRIPR